jgi:hypothetical protein
MQFGLLPQAAQHRLHLIVFGVGTLRHLAREVDIMVCRLARISGR